MTADEGRWTIKTPRELAILASWVIVIAFLTAILGQTRQTKDISKKIKFAVEAQHHISRALLDSLTTHGGAADDGTNERLP